MVKASAESRCLHWAHSIKAEDSASMFTMREAPWPVAAEHPLARSTEYT